MFEAASAIAPVAGPSNSRLTPSVSAPGASRIRAFLPARWTPEVRLLRQLIGGSGITESSYEALLKQCQDTVIVLGE
ncbi:hypothetical protein B0H14DRAFT_3457364 [Mycena olivaceomarginata]|nr:hypothetical protein B0H14DRAFT_3457364 [Mycena olivaceomarginata]